MVTTCVNEFFIVHYDSSDNFFCPSFIIPFIFYVAEFFYNFASECFIVYALYMVSF